MGKLNPPHPRRSLEVGDSFFLRCSRITQIYNESLSNGIIQSSDIIKGVMHSSDIVPLEKVTNDKYDELSKDSDDFLRKRKLKEMTGMVNASSVIVGDKNTTTVIKEDKDDR